MCWGTLTFNLQLWETHRSGQGKICMKQSTGLNTVIAASWMKIPQVYNFIHWFFVFGIIATI